MRCPSGPRGSEQDPGWASPKSLGDTPRLCSLYRKRCPAVEHSGILVPLLSARGAVGPSCSSIKPLEERSPFLSGAEHVPASSQRRGLCAALPAASPAAEGRLHSPWGKRASGYQRAGQRDGLI